MRFPWQGFHGCNVLTMILHLSGLSSSMPFWCMKWYVALFGSAWNSVGWVEAGKTLAPCPVEVTTCPATWARCPFPGCLMSLLGWSGLAFNATCEKEIRTGQSQRGKEWGNFTALLRAFYVALFGAGGLLLRTRWSRSASIRFCAWSGRQQFSKKAYYGK